LVLSRLRESLTSALRDLLKAPFVDKRVLEETIRAIQRALLMADVNVHLVLSISNRIRERALKESVPPGFSRKEVVLRVIYEELVKLLGGEEPPDISIPTGKGYALMLVGIQGSGKTTTAAKLAWFYKRKGLKTALVCADTYRPGAYEQLAQLADKINVPIYGYKEAGSKDPLKISIKGVKFFKEKGYDLIIVDTAGRHKDEKSLMNEIMEINEKVRPDEVMLVIDATIGQQAKTQAEAFHKAVKVGSIFITKLDGTAKGGGALSAVAVTGAKVKFIGVGEKIEDIEPFNPPNFVSRLLGMGDLKSLIDKMKEVELTKELGEELITKLSSGKFTLLDLYSQLRAIKRMGPLARLLELIPGFGLTITKDMADVASEKLDRWLIIMQSMTQEELERPRIINRSRMERIARGSGTTVKDVKELLNYYNMMNKAFRRLIRRGRRFRGLGVPRGLRM